MSSHRTLPSIAVAALVAVTAAALLAACGRSAPGDRAAGVADDRPTAPTAPTATTGRLALRPRWRWVAPPPSYVGMPAADRSGVAVTYGHSHVVLLDRAGDVRWTADRLRLRDVAPLLTSDSVVAASEEGVVAFDRATGRVRWAADLGERANTPVLAGARVVSTTWEGSLVALDPTDGRTVWRRPLPGPALGPAAATSELVVASWAIEPRRGAGVVGVDAQTGRERWAARLPPGGVSAPGLVAVDGGPPLAVVVAGDVAAHALATDSGAERWRAPLEGAGSPEVAPLDAGGRVLVGHRLGGMVLLDASGRELWRVASDGAAVRGGPAGPGPGGRFALPLHDGRLLVAGPGDGHDTRDALDPPGRVSGVATGPGGELLVSLREAPENDLSASSGW
ncbi:MAG TPA: PQQ-binding-like beta-propeller repeat protein [Acidimicrobiales bacterium]|nr:PQQ-binding-like beta-propeller repeat protein [Acidimicrobiales bacterium]